MMIITRSKMSQFHYNDWIRYFKKNNEHRLNIDFSKESVLMPEDRILIQPSIRAFQRGEASEGRNLMRLAEIFAVKTGEKDYKEAVRWFIKEENGHSSYLKKFMDYYRIRPSTKSHLDYIFRAFRKLGSLKCEVTVLTAAEIIALTYYDALSKSIDSPALKSICRQMLHDELPHIIFQSYTLSHFPVRLRDKIFRIVLMGCTAVSVWAAFHEVYRAGGYNFRKYMWGNFNYLKQSIELSQKSQWKEA